MNSFSIFIGIAGVLISLASFIVSIIPSSIKNTELEYRSIALRRVSRHLRIKSSVMYLLFFIALLYSFYVVFPNKEHILFVMLLAITLLIVFAIIPFVFMDKLVKRENKRLNTLIEKDREPWTIYTVSAESVFLTIVALIGCAQSMTDFLKIAGIRETSNLQFDFVWIIPFLLFCVFSGAYSLYVAAYIDCRAKCAVSEVCVKLINGSVYCPKSFQVRNGYFEMEIVEEGQPAIVRLPESGIASIETSINSSERQIDRLKKKPM